MLVNTNRDSPAFWAASARLKLPFRSISGVSVLRRRIYPAAVVMSASIPSIAGLSEAGSIMSPRTISTPNFLRALASLPGRTRARTLLLRLSRARTTLPPRCPVAPITKTRFSLSSDMSFSDHKDHTRTRRRITSGISRLVLVFVTGIANRSAPSRFPIHKSIRDIDAMADVFALLHFVQQKVGNIAGRNLQLRPAAEQ